MFRTISSLFVALLLSSGGSLAAPPELKSAKVNGTDLAYVAQGEGATVVFVQPYIARIGVMTGGGSTDIRRLKAYISRACPTFVPLGSGAWNLPSIVQRVCEND